MTYSLGAKSQANLVGVHPVLISVIHRAITITEQDFGLNEGCRTITRQRALVLSGASHTMDSMHIPHLDRLTPSSGGVYGHAADLVPYIDGTLRWEWGPIYRIAAAMSKAAHEQRIADKLCWGGAWGIPMSAYPGDWQTMARAVREYQARHPGPDFIDGPHFQIGRLT